ncbi:MAG: hypothetical protein ACI8P2_004010 [Candidatus Latescibacterota bacterium]|jgi:hypothetical protein
MISTFLFSACSALFPDGSNDLIPTQRGRLSIAVLLDLGILSGRDNRFDTPLRRRFFQLGKYLSFIMGPVGAHGGYGRWSLLQKRR